MLTNDILRSPGCQLSAGATCHISGINSTVSSSLNLGYSLFRSYFIIVPLSWRIKCC